MNERQRQDYLEAIGIQPWFPRVILPGAKPSVICEWGCDPEPESSAQSTLNQPPVEHSAYHQHGNDLGKFVATTTGYPTAHANTPIPDSHSILRELGYEQEQIPAASLESAEPTLLTEAVPAEEEVDVIESADPFRFVAVDISEHILAVVDLPWSGDFNQFSNLHQRLLGEIIKALDLPTDHSWKQGLFAWPILQETVPVHRRFAKEAANAYLINQFGLKRRKTVLLFGRTGAALIWGESQTLDIAFDQCRGTHERDGIRYGITYSLGELMQIPSLKAEAWANLKPLRHQQQTDEHTH